MDRLMTPGRLVCAVFALVAVRASEADAQSTPVPTVSPAQARAQYSLPWTMRPALAPTIVRVDSSSSFSAPGFTAVTLLTAGYAFIPGTLGAYARAAVVHQSPATGADATVLSNPIVFGLYTPLVAPGWRVAVFAGATLPVGGGGGNEASAETLRTARAAIPTRSAMDNALFAVNYLTPTIGVGAAFIRHGLTAQADVTLLELIRVRGEGRDADATRTNFTAGVHVGYLVVPWLTASAEFHYQHWLYNPSLDPTVANPAGKPAGQATAEIGVRANLPLSRTVLARPGVAFGFPLGGPMGTDDYRVLHLDFPVAF
jgi:hypothetical protein